MSLLSLLPAYRRQTAVGNPVSYRSLQRDVDRLFDDFFHGFGAPAVAADAAPSLEVKETEKGLEVAAELPGVDEKDVEISLADNTLTIRGEKKSSTQGNDGGYHVSERRYGSFVRSIALPYEIDQGNVTAELRNGVLKIDLPRSAAAVARKIAIKTAA